MVWGLKKKPSHKRKRFKSSVSVLLTRSLCKKKKGTENCVFHNFLLWCFAEAVTSQDVLLSSLRWCTETPCEPLWALIQCLVTWKECFCFKERQTENQYLRVLPPTPGWQPRWSFNVKKKKHSALCTQDGVCWVLKPLPWIGDKCWEQD